MYLVLVGRYSVHASAFIRTILSWPEQYLVKFLFQSYGNVTGAGWVLQCPCFGIYTHNTVPASTIIVSLNKLFIPVVQQRVQALVGRYSVHATAFIRAILSLPEPPSPVLIFPLHSLSKF